MAEGEVNDPLRHRDARTGPTDILSMYIYIMG
jgi:hypothetical protein